MKFETQLWPSILGKKDLTTRHALKTKLSFKVSEHISEKWSVLEFLCYEVLSLQKLRLCSKV